MSDISVQELEELAEKISNLREEIEKDRQLLAEKNEKLDEAENKFLNHLKDLGKTSYKSNYGTITKVAKWRVNLPDSPDAKESLLTYLEERGLRNMLTVNSNTLNSFYMKEWDLVKESGDAEAAMNFSIPGIKEPKLHETISFRKK